MSGLTGATLWFNTIVDSSGTGVLVGAASNLDFRNNIVTGTAFYAVNGNASKFANFDYNLFFNNGSGDCNGCVLGANVIQADPQYVAPGADDYSLQITSPAVDSGVDLPVDRNGGGADSHDGLEFDRGYYESF
jgi:hypothetical protein